MLTKNVIAIDLAKNVLQACHINVHGELLSNKPLSRQKMKEFLVKAKPSIVAMEGCFGSHYANKRGDRYPKKLPSEVPTLKWSYEAISKLGGFYDSKRTGIASWATMWPGWDKLQDMLSGYYLSKETAELMGF